LAIGLAAQFDAAADIGFQKKVALAMTTGAVNLFTVAPTPNRQAYAKLVVGDPPGSLIWAGNPQPHDRTFSMALVVASEGIDTNATDAAINNAVLNAMGALAG